MDELWRIMAIVPCEQVRHTSLRRPNELHRSRNLEVARAELFCQAGRFAGEHRARQRRSLHAGRSKSSQVCGDAADIGVAQLPGKGWHLASYPGRDDLVN